MRRAGVAETFVRFRRSLASNPGLVLNVGFGFGGVTDVVGTPADEDDDGDLSQVTGMATVGEIMLGGTLTPDWVLGGGIWASRIASTNYFHDHGMQLRRIRRRFRLDTWVSEHWRIGVIARLTGAVMAELEAGETWIHSTTTFPALALTATYN